MANPVDLIAKKRDGAALTREEIFDVIAMHASGELADYQMTALLMAIFLRGMSDAETMGLTEAMLRSGHVLDLSDVPGAKVDKHSTGGVGDKVSICLAPIVAACGVRVPMVCGRGLGHTGGTLDKLEAIPGFRVDLDARAFVRMVRHVGASIIGQTREIAPADKRIYALRDVTATVESIPLIVASILSKKLAEGIDGLVLDVKVGRGAFMQDLASARRLARALVRVGTRAGKEVVALITDMSTPLGRTVGNALETKEAIELLHGAGPEDLLSCTLALGQEMLLVARRAKDRRRAREMLVDAIRSGSAARTFERMIAAQGGDPAVVTDPSILPSAPRTIDVRSKSEGYVTHVDPREIGLAAMALGAGRMRVDQPIDLAVGIELLKKRGERVERGAPLARLHTRGGARAVADRVLAAFDIGRTPPRPRPLVIERIAASPVHSARSHRRP